MQPPVIPATFNGWRVKYTAEKGNVNPVGMPAVTPSQWMGTKYGTSVSMTKEIQELSFALMTRFNPTITRGQWRNVHKGDVAITNYQGFDMAGDPRADFVNGRDLNAELPKLMDGIVFAGSFVRGQVRDGHLWIAPGIGAIDASKPLPSIDTIITNNWYLFCTNNTPNPSHFAQGNGGVCVIPFILSEECPYTLAYFQQWSGSSLPDPIKLYL